MPKKKEEGGEVRISGVGHLVIEKHDPSSLKGGFLTDKAVQHKNKSRVPRILPRKDIFNPILEPEQSRCLVYEPREIDRRCLDRQWWMLILGQRRNVSRQRHSDRCTDNRVFQESRLTRRRGCHLLLVFSLFRLLLVCLRRLFHKTLHRL